jgi:hypothetical protein
MDIGILAGTDRFGKLDCFCSKLAFGALFSTFPLFNFSPIIGNLDIGHD